eukprot:scaffold686_cov342-Prasinococcus_capsulatus_cf.AAC.7
MMAGTRARAHGRHGTFVPPKQLCACRQSVHPRTHRQALAPLTCVLGTRKGNKTQGRRTDRGRERDYDEDVTSRRTLLLAKGAFTVAEGCILPIVSEFYTRPRADGDEDLSLLSKEGIQSLFPAERDPVRLDNARAALESGRVLLADERYEEAKAAFTTVVEIVPREYKLCQAALLGREKANKALGIFEDERADAFAVWWWGRGLRWPGWYIIAYLSGRAALQQSIADREQKSTAEVALFGPREVVLLTLLGSAYLLLLVNYGLLD